MTAALLMFESNMDLNKVMICCVIITVILSMGASYLYTTFTLKEMTVYQNGSIELEGRNYFGDNNIRKFSFTGYKVVKGSSNTYSGFEKTIKLTDEYYARYEDTLKSEKSTTIKFEE